MANDRIYLVCETCGERVLLAKYSPHGSRLFHTPEELEKFFDAHLGLCRSYPITLAGQPGLRLESEAP